MERSEMMVDYFPAEALNGMKIVPCVILPLP